ncbi:MAG: FtsH protease activity modulator HflK [Candidatus Omnitrophica bacterium]|nr:FtsH protease activity modulator HflK [Candidatus Omnitrophota bacterium]
MEWKDVRGPDDIINVGREKFGDTGKFLPLIVLAVFLLIFAGSSVYSIGPDEVGVVQRFGRYAYTTSPGLHAKLPFGIDKVTKIKVTKIFTQEFGMRTLRAGVKTQYSSRKYPEESIMLTGDLNILDVRWIVQFKVKSATDLLFKTRDPVDNVQDVSEVVMRRLVGDYCVDEVLTTKREEINDFAQIEIQKILDNYQAGIQIDTVKLQDVNPPDEVKLAFNEVNEAKQEKERMINQAWEAYNKTIPRARGEAEKTIRQAEGYQLDKVNRAKGEAERFLDTWAEYKKAPEITQKRLYLETMMNVLPRAKEKYIIDPEQTSILPLLNIGQKGGSQ